MMKEHLSYRLNRPIIFAHRGSSKYAPENTIAAFQMAIEQGAQAIELDVKLSLDQEVVVIHDVTVDRTTNFTGKVDACSLNALRRMDAGSHFSEKFIGEKIPTLGEVLDLTKGKYLLNIELTNYSSPHDNLTSKVASLISIREVQNSVLFSSFLPGNLRKIKKELPEVPVAFLLPPGLSGWLYRSNLSRKLSPEFIHLHLNNVDDVYIQREHQRNRRVHVWTINDPNQMKMLFKADVDGIFTDDPLMAFKILES